MLLVRVMRNLIVTIFTSLKGIDRMPSPSGLAADAANDAEALLAIERIPTPSPSPEHPIHHSGRSRADAFVYALRSINTGGVFQFAVISSRRVKAAWDTRYDACL